ncbi:Opr family porin [Candidatus Marinarcus aquaticus]|uniref:Porin n=1 Tax=Candidatus Marinarcus aquaticus TaxID=2044504 RepID=A0A4Q0XP69_9BACT|nr:Opr family porin [Candidatus Marinarcus aquaticus]RXJ56296.1 hypothetical protein CRV04_09650 [Candidatus Marinarcus aquaticus]
MKNLSLVACGLLLSSTALFAESNSIKEAFANGKTSGDFTVYHESVDHKGSDDTSVTAGSIGLSYETDTYNGVSISLGARAQHEFHEKNDTDYEEIFANDAVMHTAAIKYANSNFFVSVGRQEIDLEWLGDYNESVVAGITAIPDTTIVLGYTDRQAEIAFDTTADFEEITEDGAYVLDVKYEGIEGLLLNPYAYTAPDEADFYGFKVAYDTDMFGVTAHYAASNQDSNSIMTKEDGSIYNLEGRLNVVGLALAAGYIKTDSDGASGSIAAYGDNMSPMDDGEKIYDGLDAKTFYGSASYSIADLTLTALYSTTDYDTDTNNGLDVDEFNFIAEYAITDELSAAITYVDYDDDGSDSDYDKVFANVTYSF